MAFILVDNEVGFRSMKLQGSVEHVALADGERHHATVILRGAGVGEGAVTLTVAAEGLEDFERDWDIAVRAAQPFVSRRAVEVLEPDEEAVLAAERLADLLPETVTASVTLTTGTEKSAAIATAIQVSQPGRRAWPCGRAPRPAGPLGIGAIGSGSLSAWLILVRLR